MFGVAVAGLVPAEAQAPIENPAPDPVLPAGIATNYEFSGDAGNPHPVVRDVGMSVPVPGPNRSMWIFGDGAQRQSNGADGFPLPGTTAAVGPYTPLRAPIHLSTVTAPSGGPLTLPNNAFWGQSLIQNPNDMKMPGGAPCTGANGGYWQAAWPFGATRGPNQSVALTNEWGPNRQRLTTPEVLPARNLADLVFISFFDVCLYGAPIPAPPAPAPLSSCSESKNWVDYYKGKPTAVLWTYQRLNIAAYDPATNQIVATMTAFETTDGSCLPWQRILVQPVFSGSNLFMYGIDCASYVSFFTACTSGKVTTARVPVTQLHDGAAYQWASTVSPTSGVTAWTSSSSAAVTVLPADGSLGPLMLDVHDFASAGKGFLMTEQTSWGSHYDIYESPGPTGPWTKRTSDRMNTPRCDPNNEGFCYNLYAHPELSTPGHLVYSYYPKNDVTNDVPPAVTSDVITVTEVPTF